ncbi:MAG: hypothetical protein DRN12_06970 [Thermoplasmata archaeon]|nr:MAG: hypothetical protein DRN12_06970 [Thermoplasmata archaeon]
MFSKTLFILLILFSTPMYTVVDIEAIDFHIPSQINPSKPMVRGPIYIDGDEDFTIENGVSSGNGTIDNPYLIHNFIIRIRFPDVFREKELAGISIRNTSAYFIIEDVKLEFIDGIICYYYFYNFLDKRIRAINLHNVTNGSIENVRIKGFYQAINIENNSCNNIIENVNVSRSFCGIGANRGSNYNLIQDCHTKTYGCGICLWDNVTCNIVRNCSCEWSGFNIHKSHDNIIINCTSSHCGRYGVSIYGNEGFGLRIYSGSYNNTIRNCVFIDNRLGVKIYGESNRNKVYYNDFIDNDQQAYDECVNQWDNSLEGNYWSDYNGSDSNNDGIGDTAYLIPGGDNKDRYPLMHPINYFFYPSSIEKEDFFYQKILNFTSTPYLETGGPKYGFR